MALAVLRKRKIDGNYPRVWTHIGFPPAGVDKALEIIKTRMPSWSGNYGGTIEWVSEPFYAFGIKAAGTVLDVRVPRIKVMYFQDVSQCALAHEIFHVWQNVYEKGEIQDGDSRLYSWVNETNRQIKAAVG